MFVIDSAQVQTAATMLLRYIPHGRHPHQQSVVLTGEGKRLETRSHVTSGAVVLLTAGSTQLSEFRRLTFRLRLHLFLRAGGKHQIDACDRHGKNRSERRSALASLPPHRQRVMSSKTPKTQTFQHRLKRHAQESDRSIFSISSVN